MKVEIKFNKEIPHFLFREGTISIRIYGQENNPYLDIDILSESITPVKEVANILFDGTLEHKTTTNVLSNILLRGNISGCDDLRYTRIVSRYSGFPQYGDSVSVFKRNFNEYLTDPKGKSIILTVSINDRTSAHLKVELEKSDRRELLLSEKWLTHDPSLSKELDFWVKDWYEASFVLTGEPFTTRSQCLYSGTIFPGFGDGIPYQSKIIPLLYSDPEGEYQPLGMGIKSWDQEIVRIGYGTRTHSLASAFEAKDENTNSVIKTTKHLSFHLFFEDLATKPEIAENRNFCKVHYATSQDSDFQNNMYKEELPKYIFPWYHRIINILKQKKFQVGKLTSETNGFSPSQWINFLSKKEYPNKFKLPLPLEINSVLPIFQLQDYIDRSVIDKMILNLLLDMYNNKHSFWKASISDIQKEIVADINLSDKEFVNKIVYGSFDYKPDKKDLFTHYRKQVLKRANLPPLYYQDF